MGHDINKVGKEKNYTIIFQGGAANANTKKVEHH